MIIDGLLWFDDDAKRALANKVERAVQRYRQKYGHTPDVCYVHPAALAPEGHPGDKEGDLSLDKDVKVIPAKSVLPHHFWLGVQEAGGRRQEAGRKAQDAGGAGSEMTQVVITGTKR